MEGSRHDGPMTMVPPTSQVARDDLAPAFLVARLKAVAVHVLDLAEQRDPDGALALGVAAVREKVRTALSTRSESLAHEVIAELRALARHVARPQAEVVRLPQGAVGEPHKTA